MLVLLLSEQRYPGPRPFLALKLGGSLVYLDKDRAGRIKMDVLHLVNQRIKDEASQGFLSSPPLPS